MKKTVLNHSVYYIGYLLYRVNPLYLMINRIKSHHEEKDEDKYLIISSKNGDTIQKH